ncbi:MAG: hypothetical protein GY791_20050 [Alphaproteobacteria bacterium]|nr:hypothetical protein [Alphaproteobacteria bacterium]
MNARKAYIVCASPRSGSGVLCEALWTTGRAGQPDEYFGRETMPIYWQKWGVRDYPDYVRRMISMTTTANGIFGVKIHALHRLLIDEVFRGQSDGSPTTGLDRLVDHLPNVEFVWLRRRDRVRQAISWSRASLNQQFYRRRGDPVSAMGFPFDFDDILERCQELKNFDRFWDGFLRHRGIDPLRLFYEDDLEHDFRAGTRRALDWIGVDNVDGLNISSTFCKQSDELSERYCERFKTMLANRPSVESVP